MDALAHHRRAQGLPALSLNWGPWAEVGMAARLGLGDRHAQLGLHALEPALGLQAMGRCSTASSRRSACWRWTGRSGCRRPRPVRRRRCSRSSRAARATAKPGAAGGDNIAERLLLAEPAERLALIETRVRELVVAVLGLGPSQFDPDQPLTLLGVDSLLAMQLKTRIEHDLGIKVSVIDLLKGSSSAELAAELADRVVPMDDEVARLLAEVELLSPDAVKQLLA